jgi:hypothetical protein
MWLFGLISGMLGMVLLAGGNDLGLICLIPLLIIQVGESRKDIKQ